jgi:hypothetical protein
MGVIDVMPGTLEMKQQGGARILSLPIYFGTPGNVRTDAAQIDFDIYGRITKVEPIDNPSFGRYTRIYKGSRTSITMTLTTIYSGKMRATYLGNLNLTGSGSGLISMPSTLTVKVDDESQEVFARLDGTQIVGFEFITSMAVAPGVHTVVATFPNTVTDAGILDVSLCHS